MRGLNRTILSGNVQDKITYGSTRVGAGCCSFVVASSRTGQGQQVITTYVKVNAYGDGLVRLCRARLKKGVYILIEGELMNRDGVLGDLTEVRARELVFPSSPEEVALQGEPHGV